MITQIDNLQENVQGFDYSGVVTGADYEAIIFPALEQVAKEKKKIRLIIRFDEKFSNLSLKAMMDDAFVGMKYFGDWERFAIVSDHSAINHAVHAFSFLMPGKIKIFPLSAFSEAVSWVSSSD